MSGCNDYTYGMLLELNDVRL